MQVRQSHVYPIYAVVITLKTVKRVFVRIKEIRSRPRKTIKIRIRAIKINDFTGRVMDYRSSNG